MASAPARTIGRFVVRAALPEDAEAAAALLTRAFEGTQGWPEEARGLTADGFRVLLQTGSEFLVAEAAGALCGLVRRREEDGIGSFDLLASSRAGAGRALVRALEAAAQDRGFRLLRAESPDDGALPAMFQWWGYLPIGRRRHGEASLVMIEKRLPLLTVREQRRADAAAIAGITGEDPWPYEQGQRPGVFVLADGDRVVGVVTVRDAGAGSAEVANPVLLEEYLGRALELWMIERGVTYAATRGFVAAQIQGSDVLDGLRRELEDRRWFPEHPAPGATYHRVLEALGEPEPLREGD
ncbi:MAG: hypothetical protein ACR2HN_11235 [Tepidiformaceae bacterium]